MTSVNTVFFICICICAVIGAIVLLPFIVFVSALIIGTIVETVKDDRELRRMKRNE